MTEEEFRKFEKKTYDILETIKPTLKAYVNTWGPLDLESVKSTADTLVGYIMKLDQEFDDWLFNFVTDDEFARWLEKEKIAHVFVSIKYSVQRFPDSVNKEESK